MENYDEKSENAEAGVELDLNLSYPGSDSDNAENTEKAENKNYAAAVKCVFAKPKNILGAFCILLRKHDLKMLESVLWTTKSAADQETNLSLNVPWEEFSTKIPSIGPIDKESSERLKNALKNKLTKETIDGIFRNPKSNVVMFISEVRELFETNLHYLIKLDLDFEPFSRERLVKSGYERDDADSPQTAESEGVSMSEIMTRQMDSMVILCSAIVDPVHGIAASELKPGDLAEVVLPMNSPMGVLLSNYYAKLQTVPEYPVKKVEMSENGSFIISLEADGGVTCVIKTTSDLRIKARKGSDYEAMLSGRGVMIMAGIGALAVIAGLIWLIIWLLPGYGS